MALARQVGITGSNTKLDILYDMCFKKKPDGTLHTADVDTRLCAELYFYLIDQREKRVYFHINFSDNEIAKHLGARWDTCKKLWYVYESNRFMPYLKKWFCSNPRTTFITNYFIAPTTEQTIHLTRWEKDDELVIKQLGGYWDESKNTWCIVKGNPYETYIMKLFA
jgi:hypothetical protein